MSNGPLTRSIEVNAKNPPADCGVEAKEMPYIKPEDRPKYEKTLKELIEVIKSQPVDKMDGEVNYCVTRLLKGVYPPKYFNYNRAIGVLECIKLEFYRRMVGPYEDTKIKESGDV